MLHFPNNAMMNPFYLQVFVFLLSLLMTVQQALTSGYLNSVITSIEKRYEIPSSISGIIASMYEIGNVITVIFVSYLGSRRHIPVWIGMGKLILTLTLWCKIALMQQWLEKLEKKITKILWLCPSWFFLIN